MGRLVGNPGWDGGETGGRIIDDQQERKNERKKERCCRICIGLKTCKIQKFKKKKKFPFQSIFLFHSFSVSNFNLLNFF